MWETEKPEIIKLEVFRSTGDGIRTLVRVSIVYQLKSTMLQLKLINLPLGLISPSEYLTPASNGSK